MKDLPTHIDYMGWKLKVLRRTGKYIASVVDDCPEEGQSYYGCLDLENNRILIATKIPEFMAWETLLHEMTHAAERIVSSELGLRSCDLSEEKVLSLYSRVFCGMLVSSGILR